MEREISDDIEIANSFMLFQSIQKSPAVDKTASVFDKLNLNVKKNKNSLNMGFMMQILLDTSLGR